MAYIDGENLIVTAIKAHANFDADNVFQAKWGPLNSGDNDHYAILKGSPSTPVFITPTIYQTEQRTIIEVWKSYEDDGTTTTALYGYVGNVITQIQDNEQLGDTAGIIQNSAVENTGPVMEMWVSGGGPAWLKQEVIVLWHEQTKSA